MDIQTTMQSLGNGLTSKTIRLPAMFPWPCESLEIPRRGFGLGNPFDTGLKNMAEPWLEQIGYAVFVRDPVTHALVLAGNSSIVYFQTGPGEAPPSNVPLPGYLQNIAGTNTYPKGAPGPRDWLFAAIAMGVSIGRPFSVGDPSPRRSYAPWVDSYGDRARDLLWTSLGAQLIYPDATCNFELGGIDQYPPHAGQYGGPTVRCGGGFGVLGMLPICRGPVYFGAQDESNQARITLTSMLEPIVLDEDALASPTVSDLVVPIKLTLYGDRGPWCGPCTPTSDDLQAMIAKGVAAALAARNA